MATLVKKQKEAIKNENKTSNAKTTKASKNAKVEEKVDKKNLENVEKKITNEKELMYNYPKDIDTLALRKKFRTKARAKLSSFQKKIGAAKKEELVNLKKEAQAWGDKTFTKGNNPFS